MGWLILWVIFGLVAGSIANGRGNGFASGCLWGVFLGPLGVLITLLSSPNAAEIERRQLASGEMDMCPHCSELIRPTAAVCKHCGRDVPLP